MTMLLSIILLYKSTDYQDETVFYFRQFIAAVKYSENEFFVLSDSLDLYHYNVLGMNSWKVLNLRDQIAEGVDVSFIKDSQHNIFIQSQDQIHLIADLKIISYPLIPRAQRFQTIFHPYNFLLSCVGSYGIDIYQITYTSGSINVKLNLVTQSLHLHAIGISYNQDQPQQIYILDKNLGLVIATLNMHGSLSLESQKPLQIEYPLMIAATTSCLYIASKSWLFQYNLNTYKQLRSEKIKDIQSLIVSEDREVVIVVGFNRHYVSNLEWKFIGLHDVILQNHTLFAITGTNVYQGYLIKQPYRLFCADLHSDNLLTYTLYYNTSVEQHVQVIQVQQIETLYDSQLVKIALSIPAILIILLLFGKDFIFTIVCLYVYKLKVLHQQHEKMRKKLENQQHTRITLNSQMF